MWMACSMTIKQKLRAGKGFWYMQHIEECVLCGRTETLKERMPPPAPPKQDRYRFKQDACGHHFM